MSDFKGEEERTSLGRGARSENDPGCVNTQKSKDDENNFLKSIATERAHEVSTTRNDTRTGHRRISWIGDPAAINPRINSQRQHSA
jgi:hypothetical protein